MKPPRFRLAVLPTALTPAVHLQEMVGGPLVWVKRDDLTGFATAGNKARALEFLVGDALAAGCDTLVGGGGAGSNFCAATAAAAAVAGLDCHLLFPGDADQSHPNLLAARAAGAQLHFTGRPDRNELDEAIPALAADLAADGRRPYAMPRGGATPVGALGYANAYQEIDRQLADHAVEPGVMVVATGSGGTLAGLLAGQADGGGDGWRIVGATVSRPPGEIRRTVAELADVASAEIVDARGPGFGLPSDAGQRAGHLAQATEGLILDPTYTAKAFAVVLGLIAAGYEQPIVFWHTGGLAAALHHLASERSTLCPTPT